jgi:phosphoribosylanthranilate isomerase
MATRIKVCGITRLEDAQASCNFGADAIGFVFYSPSPRYIEASRATVIHSALPPFISSVGLFVDADAAVVNDVLRTIRLDYLQFHGAESPAYCEQFGLPYLKAVRVKPGVDLLQYATEFKSAKALLLDAYVEGLHGGTGQGFDWQLIPKDLPLPIILSGGLGPDNVSGAINVVRPWAVDVSSGVEASKGIKDPDKLERFMRGVRNADV